MTIIASGAQLRQRVKDRAEVPGVAIHVAASQQEVVGPTHDRDEVRLELDGAADLAADVGAGCTVLGEVLVDEAVLARDGLGEDVRPGLSGSTTRSGGEAVAERDVGLHRGPPSSASAQERRARVSSGSITSSTKPETAAADAVRCSSAYSSASSSCASDGSGAASIVRRSVMPTAWRAAMMPISASGQAKTMSAPRSREFMVMTAPP